MSGAPLISGDGGGDGVGHVRESHIQQLIYQVSNGDDVNDDDDDVVMIQQLLLYFITFLTFLNFRKTETTEIYDVNISVF